MGIFWILPLAMKTVLLIRPKRLTSTRNCHPERSAAESKDLRLPFAESVQLLKGRINKSALNGCALLTISLVQNAGQASPSLAIAAIVS
jgi:hypothetical protein